MEKGINMGRKCPWTETELIELYNRLGNYAKSLSFRLVTKEGMDSAAEAYAAYNMFKLPVIYVFIHYHYGKFEDLGMSDSDISLYITTYMMSTKKITQGILEGLQNSEVFFYDSTNELSPFLERICEEVIDILDS